MRQQGPGLTKLKWCREQATQLTAKLKGRDEEGARQMLDDDPRLMHTKDPHTGLPPLHTATKMVRARASLDPADLWQLQLLDVGCSCLPRSILMHSSCGPARLRRSWCCLGQPVVWCLAWMRPPCVDGCVPTTLL